MKRRALLKQLGSAAALALAPRVSLAGIDGAPELRDGQAPAAGAGGAALATPPAKAGVYLNQLGFRPGDRKRASVANLPGGERRFRVRAVGGRGELGKVVFEGELPDATEDRSSGDRVTVAEFSAVKDAGMYRVEAGGVESEPFPVREGAYAEALRTAMRAFYGQRCGCKVDLGGGYKHALCHKDGAFHASAGRSGKVKNHGGWHDAGDYGRYVVNSGISAGTLLWAWEMFPEALRGMRLGIPESGGRVPDFLAEVRWNLEWMLSMQDADGGVWHKQTSERFCAFIMPEKDDLPSYVIGSGTEPYKTTAATADLAAVAAIAARCFKPYDAGFAERCLAAARSAMAWATAHPDLQFKNPPGVTTGEYGDPKVGDEVLWAAAEMWRTTGEAAYEEQFLAGVRPGLAGLTIDTPGWGSLRSFACWTYAMAERAGAAPEVKERVRAATRGAAEELVRRGAASGYGHTLEMSEFVWGSNAVAANQSLLLAVADRFEESREMRDAALNNVGYLLGRNCHGVSWVTQVGARPFLHPHHRPSAADRIPEPWPGLLSGGPNARPGDEVARGLPKAAPMRMWVDDERAYSMNEVAINWNAPLVFALAAANHWRA